MPRVKLEEIIRDFKIEDLVNFFRLKTQVQGNFRSVNEKLSQYNDDFFSNFCKLGQIEFSTTEKLIVAGAEVKRDLNERSGKKYQYENAKKIFKELAVYSAGIFIFYDSKGSFRFSLIYPEAAGRRREWSSFRRFTYFVNKEFTNKTFLSRIGDGDFSSLAKVKDAFSVEKVTKEFYSEYRKLFERILNELSKNHAFKNEANRNNINPENFAKKLLGQIVFLYFVQKKGWLGVLSGNKWGEGNKNFMGDLFREAMKKKANFFNDYLEKLFYNALNNPRRNSVDPSFSKDFNCRIPFLNGGLFEAEYNWEDSLIYLDNDIFKAIFDVFERYNFTIEEESPDDKEVAVDPEMLGKVFENLLPENLRKGKGTYYTPREIVYYMCRESLVNYLVSNHSNITEENIRNYIFYSESFENFKQQKGESFTPGQWKELDDLLKNIKVCDPACGSGAFLVGMLNLIVKLRIYLQTTPDFHSILQKTEYELKKETIQNCIYGVDIDPGAIEIAKLRLWLSLVVDYSVEDIEPLPNLDYRLMCGNSLLDEYEGVKFYNGEDSAQQASLLVDTEKQKKVAELKKKVKEYFDIHDDKEKQAKRKEINDIKDWLVRSALEKRKHDLAAQRKSEEVKANMLDKKSREQYLASWGDKFLAEAKIKEVLDDLHNPPKAAKPFFIWKLEFMDVFEDKKGFDVVIANPPYVDSERMTNETPELRNLLSKKYFTAQGNWDLYIPFWELGYKIVSDNGLTIYITPNKWLSIKYGEKLRELLTNHIYKIGNCDLVTVFEAGNSPVVVLATRKEQQKIHIDIFQDDYSTANLLSIPSNKISVSNWGWLLSQQINIVYKVLESSGKKKYSCESPFTVSEAYSFKNLLTDLKIASKFSEEKHFKFVNTGTIERYYSLWGIDRTKYLDDRYLFPAILKKEFLAKFPKRYKQSNRCKIIISGIRHFECLLDQKGQIIAGKSTIILINEPDVDIKVVLGILNSRLITFFIKQAFGSLGIGGGINFTPDLVDSLPIPDINTSVSKKLIYSVNDILNTVSAKDYIDNPTKQVRVKEYEKQIDQMVYKLYGLTSEEIKIVENGK